MKHRRKIRHRHTAIAATAVAAIAVPSAAMAGGSSWAGGEPPEQHESTAPNEPTVSPTSTASSAPSTSPTPTTSPTTSTSPTDDLAAKRQRVVELVNKERAKAGCEPVTAHRKLTTAAQRHSEDMAEHQNMSHTGSDGSDAGDRIARTGYQAGAWAENIAYGYATPEEVMRGWMNSSGHRQNILNCRYEEIGVGLAQPGDYWTQNFATPR